MPVGFKHGARPLAGKMKGQPLCAWQWIASNLGQIVKPRLKLPNVYGLWLSVILWRLCPAEITLTHFRENPIRDRAWVCKHFERYTRRHGFRLRGARAGAT